MVNAGDDRAVELRVYRQLVALLLLAEQRISVDYGPWRARGLARFWPERALGLGGQDGAVRFWPLRYSQWLTRSGSDIAFSTCRSFLNLEPSLKRRECFRIRDDRPLP